MQLHAEYNERNDEYLHHRVVQAYEISELLRFAQAGTQVSIFAGDLNCEVGDVPYRLITYNTGFTDSFMDSPAKVMITFYFLDPTGDVMACIL